MNNNEILLLKLGEVVLKGLNRRSFEDKLVSNVRRRMKPAAASRSTFARALSMWSLRPRTATWRPPSRLPVRCSAS